MHGSKVMLCTEKHDSFLQRGITQERGITLITNKIWVNYFFMNSYMKFQKPSMHSSKVILCIKKIMTFFFRKGHNSRKGHNPDKKKLRVNNLCHE